MARGAQEGRQAPTRTRVQPPGGQEAAREEGRRRSGGRARMTRYLTIHVRAHEGRYHGDGDDPPSPFRLFQALVAGAGISGPLDGQTKSALAWLEGLPDAP